MIYAEGVLRGPKCSAVPQFRRICAMPSVERLESFGDARCVAQAHARMPRIAKNTVFLYIIVFIFRALRGVWCC